MKRLLVKRELSGLLPRCEEHPTTMDFLMEETGERNGVAAKHERERGGEGIYGRGTGEAWCLQLQNLYRQLYLFWLDLASQS